MSFDSGARLRHKSNPDENTCAQNMSIQNFPHIVEIENIHAIVSLLCQDCGISFLYKSAVEQEINDGRLRQIPLSDFMVMHDFTFLWNKDSVFSQEYEVIFNELQSSILP